MATSSCECSPCERASKEEEGNDSVETNDGNDSRVSIKTNLNGRVGVVVVVDESAHSLTFILRVRGVACQVRHVGIPLDALHERPVDTSVVHGLGRLVAGPPELEDGPLARLGGSPSRLVASSLESSVASSPESPKKT